MVIAWIHLLVLLPSLLFSAEFTASVSRNEVGSNEGFRLELTLKDATAQTQPSVELLKRVFLIRSQQQSSNTMITNGKVSSSHTWTLSLVPQVMGEVQIPPIDIVTSKGRLSTQPITMRISQDKKSHPSQIEEEIRLEADVSNPSPYKNEPFFLTVRLISKRALSNLQVGKFEVDGAIVETAGEPTISERLEQGLKVSIVEFKYLITPFKSGSLTIPPVTIQGGILHKRSNRSLFDTRSLFEEAFDPISLLQHGGSVSYQPIVLATGELALDVRPPVGNVNPWLPARALDIKENWDGSQTFREGEIITRSFFISAEGIHSSQLPSLEKMQDGGGQFRVYGDKPELKDEIVDGKLKSYRSEHYTLIPQRAGDLTLPEISVGWWDTDKDERREARLSGHSLRVLPNLVSSTVERQPITVEAHTLVVATHPLLYFVIGGLVILLVVALAFLVLLQRKMNRLLKDNPTLKVPSSSRRERLGELNPT